MDLQKYIASGILEQYVLGQLTDTERSEVERYAVEHPEIRQEIEAIEGALEQYAQLSAVNPPTGMEAKILDQIKGQKNVATERPKTPLEKPMKKTGSAALLGILALLAAFAAIFWGWSQKQNTEVKQTELNNLQVRFDSLQADCDRRLVRLQNSQQVIAFLRNENTTPVQMSGAATGTDKAPDAVATVFWNSAEKKSYLDIGSLPAVPSDKQYQLWAIVDGTPTDMGVFDLTPDETGLVEVPFIENPQAFAVTLEPRGGVASPTLSEMYVVGNAG